MRINRYVLLGLFLMFLLEGKSLAQVHTDDFVRQYLASVAEPNLLSTHPFGIYMTRVSPGFRLAATSKPVMQMHVSNGNVWLPYVKAYIPVLEADRSAMAELDWHLREGPDILQAPSRTLEFEADGVIRLYQYTFLLPVREKLELRGNIRAFSIDGGRKPFSLLTNDAFIEWFHSNVAGGEDPFSRKLHAYDQVKYAYTDVNGRKLILREGEFVLSGVELRCNYYPELSVLRRYNLYVQGSLQAGFNTTRANPSMDLGLSLSLNKLVVWNQKNVVQFGVNSSALIPQTLVYGSGMHFADRSVLFATDFLVKGSRKLDENRFVSLGLNFSTGTPYNSSDDFTCIVLTGDRSSSHWAHAISHLYKKSESISLFISYSFHAYALWIGMREDSFVDNAPDAQTSLGFAMRM